MNTLSHKHNILLAKNLKTGQNLKFYLHKYLHQRTSMWALYSTKKNTSEIYTKLYAMADSRVKTLPC